MPNIAIGRTRITELHVEPHMPPRSQFVISFRVDSSDTYFRYERTAEKRYQMTTPVRIIVDLLTALPFVR